MMPPKKSILLRIPPDLWELLNQWARSDLRSFNAQIEWILREAARRRFGVAARGESAADQGEPDDAEPSGREPDG